MSKPSKAISPARVTALQLVHDIMEEGLYANLALEKALRDSVMPPGDRRLVSEMVNGTVRMIRHLDWVLNLFLGKNIEQQNPWLRNILRLSAYQILFMDRIPAFACVNEAVELTRSRVNEALSRVTNAVLRNIIRQRDSIEYPQDNLIHYLSVYYSHPEWLVARYLSQFGPVESERILRYDNTSPTLVLRVNALSLSREQLLDRLQAEEVLATSGDSHPLAIRVEALNQSLSAMNSFSEGCFYVQNEASMLAGSILDPQPEELVYDFCCGVGGKSTHLAELMENRGEICAFDRHQHKIILLQQNCQRLHLNIVNPQAGDIMSLDFTAKAKADRVLADVPCSGLGVLNRRADSRWHKQAEDIEALTHLQLGLLTKAGECLRMNGLLLYATCTVNPDENQGIVAKFLQANKFALVGFQEKIAFFPLDASDREAASRGQLTILPGKYDTDGMFYALMRRKNIG